MKLSGAINPIASLELLQKAWCRKEITVIVKLDKRIRAARKGKKCLQMVTVIGQSNFAFLLIFKLPNYFTHLYTRVEMSATDSEANQIAFFF